MAPDVPCLEMESTEPSLYITVVACERGSPKAPLWSLLSMAGALKGCSMTGAGLVRFLGAVLSL